MTDGWRGWLQRLLNKAIVRLDKKPLKKWTQQQQNIGIAIGIAVTGTCLIWLFILMHAGLQFERSHDILAGSPPSEAAHDQIWWSCAKGEDLRTSDLCAQWKAADAARKSAEWSVTAFVFGTAINFLTLLGVALGWGETRKSTKAANEQVGIAREELSASTRAWVSLKFNISGSSDITTVREDELNIYGEAVINNHGNSPAMNISCKCTFIVVDLIASNLNRRLQQFCVDAVKGFKEEGRAQFPNVEPQELLAVATRDLRPLERDFDSVTSGLRMVYLLGCVLYKSPHVDHVCVTGVVQQLRIDGDQFFEDNQPPFKWPIHNLTAELPRITITQ